jgi:hypothetical protein
MSTKPSTVLLAAVLGSLSLPAHAQNVPLWVAIGIVSPVPMFLLCLILGVVARSAATGLRHAAFVFAWIVLFTLASYFVENDYVIWTPLALYLLHGVLLLALIVRHVVKRIGRSSPRA